jgi:hypothetical protein
MSDQHPTVVLVHGVFAVSAFTPEPGDSAFSLSASAPGSTLGDALDAHPIATAARSSSPGPTASTSSSPPTCRSRWPV